MFLSYAAASFCYSVAVCTSYSSWTHWLVVGAVLGPFTTALPACSSSSSSGDSEQKQATVPVPRSGEAKNEADTVDDKNLVTLELVANVTSVAPGAEIELAAHFRMAPGWHIYWKNPGESGLETRVQFRGPAGMQLANVLYPGPERFASPGNVTSYGYKDSVALFARGRAPAQLGAGSPVEFRADARWLACREVCIQGKGRAELTLPVAGEEAPARANQDLLGPYRERLPLPFAELEGATHEWQEHEEAAGQRTLLVRVPDAQSAEFFPAMDQPAIIANYEARTVDGRAELKIDFRGTANPALPAGGVVRVERAGGTARYYHIEIPWT